MIVSFSSLKNVFENTISIFNLIDLDLKLEFYLYDLFKLNIKLKKNLLNLFSNNCLIENYQQLLLL